MQLHVSSHWRLTGLDEVYPCNLLYKYLPTYPWHTEVCSLLTMTSGIGRTTGVVAPRLHALYAHFLFFFVCRSV